MIDTPPSAHEEAANTFAQHARDAIGEAIHELILFGSTVRGETRGIDSDVDVFVVLEDATHEEELREIAYDISLEHGIVISLHTQTVDRFAERKDHPFVKNVLSEGRSYV